MPKARIEGKLPIEIVVNTDEPHHTSAGDPGPALIVGLLKGRLGGGCGCHPTGANHCRFPPVPLRSVW
jgi:hypothetical protein